MARSAKALRERSLLDIVRCSLSELCSPCSDEDLPLDRGSSSRIHSTDLLSDVMTTELRPSRPDRGASSNQGVPDRRLGGTALQLTPNPNRSITPAW
jgi:hypothetical protein